MEKWKTIIVIWIALVKYFSGGVCGCGVFWVPILPVELYVEMEIMYVIWKGERVDCHFYSQDFVSIDFSFIT